jgi:hypothetical protein
MEDKYDVVEKWLDELEFQPIITNGVHHNVIKDLKFDLVKLKCIQLFYKHTINSTTHDNMDVNMDMDVNTNMDMNINSTCWKYVQSTLPSYYILSSIYIHDIHHLMGFALWCDYYAKNKLYLNNNNINNNINNIINNNNIDNNSINNTDGNISVTNNSNNNNTNNTIIPCPYPEYLNINKLKNDFCFKILQQSAKVSYIIYILYFI